CEIHLATPKKRNMRAVLQRVSSASVTVNGAIVSSINQGICVLLGIANDDTQEDMDYMVKKILNVRVFADEAGEKWWQRSVKDAGLEVLCVSQFTLYGSTTKGYKPDFHNSMKSESSKEMYAAFLEQMKREYVEDRIKDGIFGAMMQVNIVNEGPVTLELDSRKFEYVDKMEGKKTKSDNKKKKQDEEKRT
ncbi:7905_t:CDS:2, partial [Acaulospora morrowiae]